MDRIDILRKQFDILNCDAFLITSYPSVFYYSGFTSEDAYLFITKNSQYIITDSRYTIQAKNESKAFNLISGYSGNFEYIKPLAVKENIKKIAFEDRHITYSAFSELKKHLDFAEFIESKNKLQELRRVKSESEIKKISAALSVAEYALEKTLPHIQNGVSEMYVAAILESYMRQEGAEKTSFQTICASGVRSALPHGAASSKIIEKGDFLTLDFGCVFEGYCSDITRTFVISSASDKQVEIYNTVLNAQKSAEEFIKSGVSCKKADSKARNVIEKAGFGENFGHSLGHGVGIEIHELPNLSPKSDSILECGNIVTVEPGIYIENFGGVRIEDMVLIKENSIEILTKFPKELTII